MNATAFIKMALDDSKAWATGLLTDMKDEPMTQPTERGGNHPLWILGHLVYSESTLFDQFIHGRANRFEEWQSLFGVKSTPVLEADGYPTMDELFDRFEGIRPDVLAHLTTLDEGALDQASNAPEDFGPTFATVGGCYYAMVGHAMFHSGQTADARRAAGRSPLAA